MTIFAVTAQSLSVPADPAGLENFAELLTFLRSVAGLALARVACCDAVPAVLHASGQFPYSTVLAPLIGPNSHLDANDLVRVATDVLDRCDSLESLCGVQDLTWASLSIEPSLVSDDSAVIQQDRERAFVLLALAPETGWAGPSILSDRGDAGIKVVDVAIDVIEVVEPPEPIVPLDVRRDVRSAASSPEHALALDEVLLWPHAESDDALRVLIRVACLRALRGEKPHAVWTDVPEFTLGEEFGKSCDTHLFMTIAARAEKLLATLVDVLLHRADRKGHHLRVDSGANSPQRKRGNDGAWRWDIDYEYHLHFWRCSGDVPEFAAVVVHNDFSIPE